MRSQSLLTSVLAAVATAVLAPRGALAQSSGAYLGCYVDAGSTGTRTLNYGAYTASNNTNELCQSTCFDLGYAYSGTEYGIQCFCDNMLDSSTASDGECNVACSGDSGESCGGSWRLTVYSTGSDSGTGSLGPPPSLSSSSSRMTGTSNSLASTTVISSATAAPTLTATTSAGAGYLGCYVDNGSSGARTLNYGAYSSSDNTNEKCQSTCAGLGYAYSGTEYGTQCFCDNTLNANVTDAASCSSTCAGDTSETCGGSWLLTVYSTGIGAASGSSTSTSLAMSSGASTTASATSTSTTALSTTSANIAASSSRLPSSSSAAASTKSSTPTTTTFAAPPTKSSTATSTIVVAPPTTPSALTTIKAGTTSATSSSALPTATGSGYVGCYLNLTPLASFAYTSAVNTNAICRATCYSKGYAYAGTTAGLQCSCAHSLGFALQAPALTCNVPCPGEWTQACGGPASVSVYKTH